MRIDNDDGVDYPQVIRVMKEAPPITVDIRNPVKDDTCISENDSVDLNGIMYYPNAIVRVTWENSLGSSGICNISKWHWWIDNIPLSDGDNVITITAYDKYNNTGTDTITVTYEGVADPIVIITDPTTNDTYETIPWLVDMGGTASHDSGISSVTWENDRGGSGTATGTENWTITGIELESGVNVITVTAYSNDGPIGTDVLTWTCNPIPGDLDGDGYVNMNDYYILQAAWGSEPGDPNWNPRADINGDLIVDYLDYFIMVQNWTE